MFRTKIFVADEGFGPIIRQSAIIEELRKLLPGLEVTLQLDRHFQEAKHIIPGITHKKKFNNIIWHKTADGTPDFAAISEYYADYNKRAEEYIKSEHPLREYDFVISDFVHEVFELAAINNIPSFGVAHFTWDWFFSKMYPVPLPQEVLKKMMDRASLADILFFPPFAPKEIIRHHRKKAVEVPLIVRKQKINQVRNTGDKPKIMLIDSGSGINRLAMETIASKLPELDCYHFFLSEVFNVQADNVTLIPKNDLLVDYIENMDLVVGRAGFNTISECIAYRTPMLLFGESMNAEIRENIFSIKEEGLGSFTSLDALKRSPEKVLSDFFEGEYPILKRNMSQHEIRTDGAKVVAETIANKIKI
jgi:uncharacterized protein (TIGR00661 family)